MLIPACNLNALLVRDRLIQMNSYIHQPSPCLHHYLIDKLSYWLIGYVALIEFRSTKYHFFMSTWMQSGFDQYESSVSLKPLYLESILHDNLDEQAFQIKVLKFAPFIIWHQMLSWYNGNLQY